MTQLIRATLFLFATFAGSLPAVAGDVYAVSLSYLTRFDKPFELHFLPTGGGSRAACEASLPLAVAAFKDDLRKSFKANYGVDMENWNKAKFVEGSCRNDDAAYTQLLKLKLGAE